MIIWVDICFWHWIIQADYAALVKDWFCIFWNFSVIVMFFNNVKYIIFYKSFRRYLCSLLKSMVSNYILNSFGNFLFIKLYFGIILKQAATSKCLLFHQTFGNIFIVDIFQMICYIALILFTLEVQKVFDFRNTKLRTNCSFYSPWKEFSNRLKCCTLIWEYPAYFLSNESFEVS